MTLGLRERAWINVALIGLSVSSWMLLLLTDASIGPTLETEIGTTHSNRLLSSTPLSVPVGFILMLMAMMAPTLIIPINHVCAQSFRCRRPRSVALFLLGYGMAAATALAAMVLVTESIAAHSYGAAFAMAIVVVGWQCSPLKQRCLNRTHDHRSLAAFGSAADGDSVRFGIVHGSFCIGSCWAFMLFPMLVHRSHLLAMAVATFMIIGECLSTSAPVRWEIRVPAKLARILVAQARIRLQRRLSPL